MKDTPLSNCERDFILQGIAQRKRLDGRECYDYRRIKISFGVDRGCCHVELGNTKVLAQVSCEVAAPRQTRPSDGLLFVNVELSPMAAPHFEAGRQSEAGVELARILERCIKESRCVDTESLCIVAAVKVWSIRCDVHILNHDGNMTDCASIAAITSLAHFRRPDVTVSGEEVTIHGIEDRDPVPLSVHHMPICVTIGFYHQGKFLLVDPTDKEEQVMEGRTVIGMNKHREICTFQLTGRMLLESQQVLRCANIAVVKVQEITALIQKALDNDTKARALGEKFGFAMSAEPDKVTSNVQGGTPINVDSAKDAAAAIVSESSATEASSDDEEDNQAQLNGSHVEMSGNLKAKLLKGPGIGQIGHGGASTWDLGDSDDERTDEEMDLKAEDEQAEHLTQEALQRRHIEEQIRALKELSTPKVEYNLGSDSEEEDVIILGSEQALATNISGHSQMRQKSDHIDLTKALKTSNKKPKKKGAKN